VNDELQTAYKAQSPGKLAQHNEAQGSGDRVNAAVVQRKFTSLSWEICLRCGHDGSAVCGNVGGDRAEAGRGHRR
jgi:hypothetical protein